jgi:flagellar motor switch protein FliM
MSSNVVDDIDVGDAVICTEFDISLSGQQEVFQVVWPTSTIASLLPVFEGKKRERDQQEDARWEHALRSTITDSIVKISSNVGATELALGAVAELAPGDVISISNPRVCTVYAEQVPVLEGRFGVHDGNYAVEAVQWLEPGRNAQASNR